MDFSKQSLLNFLFFVFMGLWATAYMLKKSAAGGKLAGGLVKWLLGRLK